MRIVLEDADIEFLYPVLRRSVMSGDFPQELMPLFDSIAEGDW